MKPSKKVATLSSRCARFLRQPRRGGLALAAVLVAASMAAHAGDPRADITGMRLLPTLPDAEGNSLGRPRLKLFGSGFPVGKPKAACVTIQDRRNPQAGVLGRYPLHVVGVPSEDCMIVELPPLPPGLPPAPLELLLGDGQRAPWAPAFRDVVPTQPACSFRGDGEPAQSPELDLRGLPPLPPQPDNVRWFFSEPGGEQDLCLILTGDWGRGPVVDVEGDITVKLQDPRNPTGGLVTRTFEIRSRGNIFPPEGDLAGCAERIKDTIRCIISQHLGLPPEFVRINCIPQGGDIKVQIQIIDPFTQQIAPLCGGGFRVCVTNEKPNPPVVRDWILNTPGRIAEGTIIKLMGENFGQSESDLIAEICTEPCPVPLEILLVNDRCIIARVGPVPVDARPAPIKIYCGSGSTHPWVATFPNLQPESPGQLILAPCAPHLPVAVFDPFNRPQPPVLVPSGPNRPEGVEYFDAFIDQEGRFCIPLTEDWGGRPLISFLGTFKLKREDAPDDAPGLVGSFLVDRTRLNVSGPGTSDDCAARIADIFRCGLDGIWDVTVDLTAGVPTLYLEVPGFDVCEGKLQLCLFRPFPRIDPVSIEPLNPGPIGPGSLVEICARPLPLDPLNLCATLGDVPLHIVAANKDKLIGRVGAVPPGGLLGELRISPGRGCRGRPIPVLPLPLPEPPSFFVGDGVDPGTLPELPGFPPESTPENVRYYVSEPEIGPNGELCLFVDGDWCPGATARFEGHLGKITADGNCTGFDWNIPDVRFPGGGDLEECVRRLKDLPACGFEQFGQARNALLWECFPLDRNGDGVIDTVKLTVRCPFFDPATGVGRLKPGSRMTLCLRNPVKDPPEIKSVKHPSGIRPICLKECDILCVEVCNFGCEAKDICAMIEGQEPGSEVPLRVVEIVKDAGGPGVDKLIIQVGKVPAKRGAGPALPHAWPWTLRHLAARRAQSHSPHPQRMGLGEPRQPAGLQQHGGVAQAAATHAQRALLHRPAQRDGRCDLPAPARDSVEGVHHAQAHRPSSGRERGGRGRGHRSEQSGHHHGGPRNGRRVLPRSARHLALPAAAAWPDHPGGREVR